MSAENRKNKSFYEGERNRNENVRNMSTVERERQDERDRKKLMVEINELKSELKEVKRSNDELNERMEGR